MERCPVIMNLFNIKKKGKCSKLYFIGDKANCSLWDMVDEDKREEMKEVFGIGDGCCIKARVYKNGIEYNFAALSSEMKIRAVQQVRENKIGVINHESFNEEE